MEQTLAAIMNRRSIRRFAEKEIPAAVLRDLLEAVRWAPSWGNSQCWEVIIVKSTARKEELSAIVTARNPATLAVKTAPVVLAMCAQTGTSGFYKGSAVSKFGDWFMFDLGVATQNVALAAHSLGLSSVIVGAFDHERAKDILNLPAGFEAVTLLPLGYPAQTPSAPARRSIEEFCHEESFTG
jgi:nitroreductase